ncbi:hypothetical protein AAULR_00735, partial [Lacticaseibacillus rhamnosus MTCC 5462]
GPVLAIALKALTRRLLGWRTHYVKSNWQAIIKNP